MHCRRGSNRATQMAVTPSPNRLEATSQDTFCLACHEMQYVEHRGWIHSSHRYGNLGVRAQCQDCHNNDVRNASDQALVQTTNRTGGSR
ncbi:MAG: NapC/NirT family cytochrome c [Deltaproteobacteria bacterium]|nr:NapC/NirT family cytochrome c [Deltaproteobacteria bacterium]